MIVSPVLLAPRVKKKPSRKRRQKYSHPKQLSLSVRILDLIEERGGMTAGQIKKQLYEWGNHGAPYDPKLHRGWWSTQLYGTGHPGLLNHFCEKVGRKWVRNAVPHGGAPWAILKYKNPWQQVPAYNMNAMGLSGNMIVMAYNP